MWQGWADFATFARLMKRFRFCVVENVDVHVDGEKIFDEGKKAMNELH